jgi:hypothetical protein
MSRAEAARAQSRARIIARRARESERTSGPSRLSRAQLLARPSSRARPSRPTLLHLPFVPFPFSGSRRCLARTHRPATAAPASASWRPQPFQLSSRARGALTFPDGSKHRELFNLGFYHFAQALARRSLVRPDDAQGAPGKAGKGGKGGRAGHTMSAATKNPTAAA